MLAVGRPSDTTRRPRGTVTHPDGEAFLGAGPWPAWDGGGFPEEAALDQELDG